MRAIERERGVLSADRDGVICGGLTVSKSVRCRVSGDPKSLVNLAKMEDRPAGREGAADEEEKRLSTTHPTMHLYG